MIKNAGSRCVTAVSVAVFAFASICAFAETAYDEGATDTEIKIGQTMPYSGPASAYSNIGRTEAAYFRMINEQGGVNGRKINFISLDDGYSPPKTVELTRKLVEEEKVLFTFNQLGTATNSAIQKYMNNRKVPHLLLASGSPKWGDPEHFPWTMGFVLDSALVGTIYAKHILATIKDPKIGILMQNDDLGKDYLNGFKAGLGENNEKLIIQLSTYQVTDATVDSQIIQLKASGANVFFNASSPRFAALAIKKAYEIDWKPVHYVSDVSASFGSVFTPAGIAASQGVIAARYQKDVTETKWSTTPDFVVWKAFMAKYMPSADVNDQTYSYGYLAASTLIQILKQCGDNLTRANIMKQAANLDFEAPMLLPGIKVKTSATNFAPFRAAQLGRVNGTSLEMFGDVITSE